MVLARTDLMGLEMGNLGRLMSPRLAAVVAIKLARKETRPSQQERLTAYAGLMVVLWLVGAKTARG